MHEISVYKSLNRKARSSKKEWFSTYNINGFKKANEIKNLLYLEICPTIVDQTGAVKLF